MNIISQCVNTGANHTPFLNHFQTFHSRVILTHAQSAKRKKTTAQHLTKLRLTIKTWIKLKWNMPFLNRKKKKKPASNNRRVLITAIFCGNSERSRLVKKLKCWKIFPVVRRKSLHQIVKNAAIDESLCDTFLDEKPNKRFSFDKKKRTLAAVHGISFCGVRTRT